MNEDTASRPATAPPYESAAEMRHANTLLLQALDQRLGTDSRPESENAALMAMRPDIEAFLQRGAATGGFVEDTQERTACQVLLDYWSSSLAHAQMDVGRPRLVPFDAAALPDLRDKRCPFVGLSSIRQPQGLFGRDRALQSLLQRLQDVPLVVVLGGSGSGKSSLVLAGALPALQAAQSSPRMRAVGPFTPGNAVLAQLLRAALQARQAAAAGRETPWTEADDEKPEGEPADDVADAVQPGADLDELVLPPAAPVPDVAQDLQRLRADPGHLASVLGTAPDGRPWVLVLDQFEEVFTLCSEPDRMCAVAALDALLQAQPATRVLLTLREEFVGDLDKLPALAPYLKRHALFAMKEWSMGYEELKAAVEGPADRVNLHFAPGLVDEMVKSVLGQDTALPLLQFALRELWRERDRNRITREVYQRIGGSPLAALETVATRFYKGLAPEERAEVQRVLVELVRINDLLEPYRHPRLLSELLASGNPRTRRVLGRLRRANLVRISPLPGSEDALVEVKHEALLRNWSLYDEWMREAREKVRQRLALLHAAQRWQAAGASAQEGLLTGWQLDDARKLADLSPLEAQYLQASLSAADRAQQQHEVELHRRAQKRAALVAGAVLAVVGLGVLGYLQHDARRDNRRQAALADLARSREAATLGRMDHALLGAVRALELSLRTRGDPGAEEVRAQARETLVATLRRAADLKRLFVGPAGSSFTAVAWQPGAAAAWLAYGGTGGQVHLAGLKQQVQHELPACGASPVSSLAFDPGGERLAVGCGDGSVGLWRSSDWQRVGTANEGVFRQRVWGLAFTPDGQALVAIGQGNWPKLITLAGDGTLQPAAALEGSAGAASAPTGGLWALAIAPQGEQFAVGDGDGRVHLCARTQGAWRCDGPTRPAPRAGDAVRALAYSPDGRSLAVGYWQGDVQLLSADLAQLQDSVDVRGLDAPVHSLAFLRACGREQLAVAKGNGILYRTVGARQEPPPSCGDLRAASVGDEAYALAFDTATGWLAAATRGAYVAVLDPAAGRYALQADGPALPREPAEPVRAAVVAANATEAWVVSPAAASSAPAGNLAVLRVVQGPAGPGWASESPVRHWQAGGALLSRVAGLPAHRLLATLGCLGSATIKGCNDGREHEVAVWQVDEAAGRLTLLRRLRTADFKGLQPYRLALTPDGRGLVLAFTPRTTALLLVPLAPSAEPQWLDTGLADVREIAISDDGLWLAAGGDAGQPREGRGQDAVQVWSLQGLRALPTKGFPQRVSPDVQKVFELVFAADSKSRTQILAGGAGSMDRWEVEGARSLGNTRVNSWSVYQLAFSRVQGLVAVADMRNVLRVWDVGSWSPVELSASGQGVQSPGVLAFGPQGRWLVSGSDQLQLWDTDLASMTRKACALLREPGQHGADIDVPLWRRDGACQGGAAAQPR